MTNIIKRVISTTLSVAVLLCAVFISASAVEVTTAYDSELSGVWANDYSPYLTFASGSESGTLYYYDVISAGSNQSNSGKLETPNQRYNYISCDSGKELHIKSKDGFAATKGFTASFELFTNAPTTGTVAFSFGQFKFSIDYAATTLYLHCGNTELGHFSTGLTAGSYDFQSVYLCNQWTIKYIDGVITVVPLSDGMGKNNTIIKNSDNTPITWTLPDGTVTTEVPMPSNVDFGYCYVDISASKEISKRCIFGQVPIGFTSNYNGNFPMISNVNFKSNCGFSTLQGYVDFVMNLTKNLNSFDVEYARNVYNSIKDNCSVGMISAVAPYESYITAAEAALVEGVTSSYNVSAAAGGKIYSNGELFVNDNVNNPIELGTSMTFTAVADAGYTFSHWANGADGIVTTDSTINVVMYLDTELKAVFTKDTAATGDDITVRFRDHSGNIIAEYTVAVGSTVTLPQIPYAFGYTCNGWLIDGVSCNAGDEIVFNKDTIVCADFAKNDATYSITVSGAKEAIEGYYTYNTLITVNFDYDAINTYEKFAGWSNGKKIVSYDDSYSFFVGDDAEINAVITTSDVKVTPIIDVMDVSLVNDGAKASFYIERWLPSDLTLVESGAIYTKSVESASKLRLNCVDGDTIRRVQSKFTTNHAQMRVNLGSTSGDATMYLTAYMTYIDAEGKLTTIYTSVYSAKVTGIVS